MNYAEGHDRIAGYRRQIAELRGKMRETQNATAPQPVEDYAFATAKGAVRLTDLFGAHDDLILIHNMGKTCPACTMWADGYNGIYAHLADRAAFVVTSPDTPDVQASFAAGRGWRFPMVSHAGTSFAADMGYRSERGFKPGISTFRRANGRVVRIADTGLQPGDDFCSAWHMFDMLAGGRNGWQMKFEYGPPAEQHACCAA